MATTSRTNAKPSRRKISHPLLVANDDYLSVLLNLLDHAEDKVELIAYSFSVGIARDSASAKVAQKLASLVRKGVQVRVYLEGRRETSARNRSVGEFLEGSGVQVKYGSTHAKGFRVDERYVLFGSTNLTHQSIAKNNETNLLFDDEAVSDGFGKYFQHLWKGGKHGGVLLPPPLIADGGFKEELVSMIDRAKTRIEFSIYFFHYTEIERAFIRAHERGVKIRGLIHDHASFAMSYVRRTRGTVERLRAAGIKDLHEGPQHLFTHSKFIICDRREILLGTGNWLHEDEKVHPQLYVRLTDHVLALEMSELLTKQIGPKRRTTSFTSKKAHLSS